MGKTGTEELIAFLRSEAGEYLRGAVYYTEDDYEVLFLRDDVAALYTDEELELLFDYYRDQNRKEADVEPFDLGNDHCTVHFYDDAILFHFMQQETSGTIITLSPEAGRDIVQFITRCLKQLHENSPQSVETPAWLRD
ncbi:MULTISPECIES: hypothetical protein [Halobacterium]|uniref:DUF7522 family protein n=1 Tax=Halobacterium TaxID=2239 RepID=UPI0009E781E0|nr:MULTISPECIES: hypothetical protein [Halobacterium]MCG1002763.1 hypothetical protein [Halobacterium noricense]